MYRSVVRHICSAAIIISLLVPANLALAWEQPAHKQINYHAVNTFWRTFALSNTEKYRLGAFPARSFSNTRFRGIAVTSNGMFQGDYKKAEDIKAMGWWIVFGGDWADEPHLYASVRHFYDPFAMWGAPYLTDQSEVHGNYDAPQIDARTWGLNHAENPFSFKAGLQYFKNAMEIPEDNYSELTPGSHWKTDVTFQVQDADDVRSIYMGLAFRALGETMHMLADMTQPAHVRNDSHPFDEPIETGVKPSHVTAAANNPIMDSRIAQRILSAGGTLQKPDDLFKQVALWTNLKFYSADTIYDKDTKVIPLNIDYQTEYLPGNKQPYDFPQFHHLILKQVPVTRLLVYTRNVPHYFGAFNGEEVPMTQERLSFHWFDPDMTVKEKIARIGSLGPYQIPRAYAPHKARALIPVAIHACADLIHLFFPTMELTASFGEPDIEEDNGYSRMMMDMHAEMLHHQDKDPGWQFAGLKINYTGPAKLVFANANGSVQKTRNLLFNQGELQKFEDRSGQMVEEPLCVYISTGQPLVPDEAYYEATDGTNLYFEIEAGGRVFKSEEYTITSEVEVEILGGDVNYELAEGETDYEHSFVAAATPPGQYRYEWDFGNGNTTSDSPASGSNSVVSNTYEDGFYTVTVELFHPTTGASLASDNISVTVIEDLRDYTLDVCNDWSASQGGGYGTTVDVWDITSLPVGTVFDIQFDAMSVPDKFVVQYEGETVLDTGWRGDSYYVDQNPGLYPGGISGLGYGTADGIFTKSGSNSFRVIVYGPESGTAWDYSMRANCP